MLHFLPILSSLYFLFIIFVKKPKKVLPLFTKSLFGCGIMLFNKICLFRKERFFL